MCLKVAPMHCLGCREAAQKTWSFEKAAFTAWVIWAKACGNVKGDNFEGFVAFGKTVHSPKVLPNACANISFKSHVQ